MHRLPHLFLILIWTIEIDSPVLRAQADPQDAAGVDFTHLRAAVDQLDAEAKNRPTEKAAATVAAWADANDLRGLSPTELVWLLDALAFPRLDEANLSVEWTGFVEAPQSGAYTFSISWLCPASEFSCDGPRFVRR